MTPETPAVHNPVHNLVESFAEWCRGPGFKKASTAESYRASLLDFQRRANVTDWNAITPVDLDAYISELQLAGIGTDAIGSRIYALRSFWKWSTSRGHLASNPTLSVNPPRRRQHLVSVFTGPEIEKLLTVKQPKPVRYHRRRRIEPAAFFEKRLARTAGLQERDAAMVCLSLDAGLRVSEATSVLWSDFTVSETGQGSLLIRDAKRSRGPVTMPLDARTVHLMHAWKKVSKSSPKDRIFPITARTANYALARLCRLAGIETGNRRLTFHCLRSTRASMMAASGIDVRLIALQLRHKGLGSVMRYVEEDSASTRRKAFGHTLPWNAKRLGL